MHSKSPTAHLKEALCESAPPVKLVHMLYEGALRFIGQAERLDPASEGRDFREKLRRASDIVSELRLALDASAAPELCGHLTSLYLFVEDQIQDAQSRGDRGPLAPATDVLRTLLDGWRGVEANKRRTA